MFVRSAAVAAIIALCLGCSGQGGNGASSATATEALKVGVTGRGSGALGSFVPNARTTAFDVSVSPSQGALLASIALPELPTRGGVGPDFNLTWMGTNSDMGQGFGVGFALQVPAVEVTGDWGVPLPVTQENGDLASRLSLNGQRLVLVGREIAAGQVRLEYRFESGDSAVRVFRWLGEVALTWPDLSERQVIGAHGERESLRFYGFQVAYPDGRQQIFTQERAIAEGADISGEFRPVRWPLRYEVSPVGEVTRYDYVANGDGHSYLRSIAFSGGRSEYSFDLGERRGGPVSYAFGFRQEASLLYTRMVARFDGVQTHEWCFVYRSASSDSTRIFTHPDCAASAERVFGATLSTSAAALSRQDRLIGILRYGAVGPSAERAFEGEPTLRLSGTEWTRELLGAHQLVYDVPVPELSGFGPEGGAELLDLNGDGLVDIARSRSDVETTEAFVNEGDWGRDPLLSRGPDVTVNAVDNGIATANALRFDTDESADRTSVLGDFDGDGYVDVLSLRVSGEADQLRATLHQGPMDIEGRIHSRGSDFTIPGSLRDFVGYRTRAVDVNGDGKDDLVQAPYAQEQQTFRVLVNLSTDATDPRFDVLDNLTFPFQGGTEWELNHPAYRFSDVNSDGLTDLVVVRQDANATGLCIYENRGNVRAAPAMHALFGSEDSSAAGSGELLFGNPGVRNDTCGNGDYQPLGDVELAQNINSFWILDVDGDGNSDVATVDGSSGRELVVWLGHGRQEFDAPFRMSIGDADPLSVDPKNPWNSRTIDIDGDGREEIIVFNPTGDSRLVRVIDFNRSGSNNWIGPDLLVGISEGEAVRSTIQYSSAEDEAIRDRRLSGASALETRGMPHPQLVVKRLIQEAASVPASVSSYHYHTPRFDRKYREFIGFERTDVFVLGDESRASQGTFYTFGPTSDASCSIDRESCYRFLGDQIVEQRVAEVASSSDTAARASRALDVQATSLEYLSEGYSTWTEEPLSEGKLVLQRTDSWSLSPATSAEVPPYYVRHESSAESVYGPSAGEAPARTSTQWAYETTTNQVVEERVVRERRNFVDAAVSAEVPEHSMRRSLSYDADWSARGVFSAVSSDTVRSELTGAVLSQSEYTYSTNQPLVTKRRAHVFTDTEGLAKEIGDGVAQDQVRERNLDYDVFGNVVAESDGVGPIARNVYDHSGLRIVESSNALGHASRVCYGSEGCELWTPDGLEVPPHSLRPTHSLSPQGETVVRTYDSLHRVTRIMSSSGGELRLTYRDADGRIPSQVLVEERTDDATSGSVFVRRLFAFTPEGKPLGVAVAEGETNSRVLEQFEYNRAGQVALSAQPHVVSAPLDAVWAVGTGALAAGNPNGADSTRFDAIGRPIASRNASGTEETHVEYFPWGRSIEKEIAEGDAKSVRVERRIEAGDEVYAVIDATGIPLRFQRDERGALVSVVPAGSPARKVLHNSAGEMVYAELPGAMHRVWFRDARGRAVQTKTWDWDYGQSTSLSHSYDALDRVIAVDGTTSAAMLDESRVRLTYDDSDSDSPRPTAAGRLTNSHVRDSVTGISVSERYDYDAQGRVLNRSWVSESAAGKREYSEGASYRLDGGLASYRDVFGNQFDLTYNAWGAPTGVSWRSTDGAERQLFSGIEYDDRGEVASFNQQVGDHRVRREFEKERTSGRLLRQTICLDDASCAGATQVLEDRSYRRRGDGHIVAMTALKSASHNSTYAYSSRDELLSATIGERTFAYQYGDAGQALSIDEGVATEFSQARESAVLPLPEGYQADSFGRLSRTPTIDSIEYDAWNRPRRVVKSDGGVIHYGYDATGRRVAKVVLGEQPRYVAYPSNDARDDGVERQRMLKLGGRRVALLVNESRSLALVDDERGVVEQAVTEDGVAVDLGMVTPFGRLEGKSDASVGLRSAELLQSFTGQIRDDETGAVLMGAREYLPELGSFSVPDPYFFESPEACADSPLECELYAYVAHDPVNAVDETGYAKGSAGRSSVSIRGGVRRYHDTRHVLRDRRTARREQGSRIHLHDQTSRLDAAPKEGSSGSIKVLGRLCDTALSKNQPGREVLSINNWSLKKNDAWVASGIKARQTFYLASSTAGNMVHPSGSFVGKPTVYARELVQLARAGYEPVGAYMVHPSNLSSFVPR